MFTVNASPSDTLMTIETVGADCPLFDITPAAPLPVLLNGSTSVALTIGFAPVVRGAKTCTLNLKNNGAGQDSFTLTGTGTGPAISTNPALGQTFPNVRVANAAVTTSQATIRITNSGDAGQLLHVSALTIGGTNGADFTVTSAPSLPAAIPAASFIDVTITFDPSGSGTRLGTLEIDSDDPATPMKMLSLSGSGTNAVIGVNDPSFGVVASGGSGTASVTVTNTAAAPIGSLILGTATISPTSGWIKFDTNGASACSGATSCNIAKSVPPNASVGLTCSPPAGATGMQTATVTFGSDTDGGGDNMSSVTCTAGNPQIMVAPTTIGFANQLVGTTSTAMSFVVTNTGNAPLTYSVSNPGTTFPVTATCTSNCTLAPLAMAMVNVAFHPTAVGAANATINVTSNDPDLVDQTIAVGVSGTGIAPQISVSPSPLDFTTVELGSTKSLTLTASNTGSSALNITSATLTSGAADFTVTAGMAGTQTVAVSGMTTWTIRCNPSATGTRSGNFRIVSDSLTGGTTNVGLSCDGQQGSLVTNPVTTVGAPLDFGGVTIGNTSTKTFTLRNPGNVAVTGITGVLSPSGVGYAIDGTTPIPSMLAAGQTATINVIFTPLVGSDGGPATIAITGTWGAAHATSVTVFLNGDGLTVGYDVTTIPASSPPVIDFGSLRFDATATGVFCIINTDQTPVTIQSPITITPNAPTMTGEFAVTSIKRNASCSATGGTTANLPQTLAMGEVLVVTVTADPANRTGAMSATATITSNLMTNATRTVGLTAMSTTAMLTTSPGLVADFGSVDRDGPPAMMTVTITNTGTAALDLSGFMRTPTTGPFTFTLPGTQSVAPGGHVDIAVTYTPTVEQAPGVSEQVVISHQIAGVLGGPASQMITIKGRGIDRHIGLDPAPVFPDTFRNPGSAAPVRPVTVHNTGEATLKITAVMITNDDVWQLVDGNPVDIPANGSHDFMVKFAPKVAGKAPVGQLTFMNNDNTVPVPMAVVLLDGNGLDRNVMMSDPIIDLGYTGIGIPVTLPDSLTITSMDPTHGFTIREIVVDDEAFAIDASPTDLALPAQTSMKYSVTFSPTSEGAFETKAHLFLDEDPLPQAEVTLKGTSVFVDVTGSGGCSTGGSTGTGAAALIVLAVLGLRRRRTAAAAVALAIVALPLASRADPVNLDVDLSLFNPTPSTTGTEFQVQPASVGENGAFAAEATLSYATDPLVLKFAGNEHMAITQRTTMELGAAYAFLGRFEAGARLPLYNQSGDGRMVGVDSPSGTARGDLALHGKAQFAKVESGATELLAGATLTLTLPTATSQEFAGVDKPTGRILGLVTLTPGALSKRLSLTANAGAVIRDKTQLSNLEQGSGLAWGAAASFRVVDQLWATGEMFGEVMPSGRKDGAMASASVLAPAEFLVGIHYKPAAQFALGVGVGRGLIAGLGTPGVRGVFELSYIPGTRALPPIHEPPPPKIDGDADGDGVKDSVDRCPNEAEDKDMFDDSDGCPDLDNDGDGFPDAQDKCPMDAEDKDGFQDDDGCPEKDNDNDGIPDAQDKCPNEPEDKDGYLDVDGCPDPDNDGDGIIDAQDMCPNEPETINGNADDDGCPDRGDALVIVTPSSLDLTEAIQFTGAKISPASKNVLGQVAATLRAHQEIVRVKIVAHVQPTNDPDKDQDLSEKRAQAVRDWLVQWGIPQNRISAAGLGGTKPLVPKTAKNAQLINDRAEIIILERK